MGEGKIWPIHTISFVHLLLPLFEGKEAFSTVVRYVQFMQFRASATIF
jgi:hypothetical protein